MIADGHEIYAFEFEGIRYDAGHKWGLIEATLNLALKHGEMRRKACPRRWDTLTMSGGIQGLTSSGL